MKDNNYYPQRGNNRCRHNHWPCSYPHAYPFELVEVIRNQHLNPHKACTDWQKGKQVCPECRFLVNMENHHLRCSAAAPWNPLPKSRHHRKTSRPLRWALLPPLPPIPSLWQL